MYLTIAKITDRRYYAFFCESIHAGQPPQLATPLYKFTKLNSIQTDKIVFYSHIDRVTLLQLDTVTQLQSDTVTQPITLLKSEYSFQLAKLKIKCTYLQCNKSVNHVDSVTNRYIVVTPLAHLRAELLENPFSGGILRIIIGRASGSTN